MTKRKRAPESASTKGRGAKLAGGRTTSTKPARARPKRLVPFALIAAIVVGGIVLCVARREPSSSQAVPTSSPSRAPSDATAAAPSHVPDAATTPMAKYIGSERCSDCHAKELAGWKTSWHARALARATPKTIVGDFHNAHFTGSSSEVWMQRKGEVATMRTRGAEGDLADFRVDYVIGGKRMQDDVTVLPDGRWQVLPVYFHVTDHVWVDYTETKQGPLSPEHPFYWTNARRMANHECLDCHTTGLHVDYDEATAKWQTTFVDGNVACEDCHGAGSIHADTSEKRDIVHPVKSGTVGMSACARCHGPRQPLFPLNDADHAFRLGDDYDELYDPIVVTLPDHTDSSDYFADGKPKTSSFEYQAMLQSACYRKGSADCLTCHTSPHDPAHRRAELRAAPEELCGKCHGAIRTAGSAHSHHKTASCVACHMAPIVSGVLDHFADHSIDVPVPQNTSRHAVPNACSVCHASKTPDDLAKAIETWWPDAHVRQSRRIRLADAFAHETSADSLRPLLAVIADVDEAPTLRGAAAIVLGRRGGPRIAPVLVKLLDEQNVLLRAKAAEALAAARATSAGDALANRTGDPSLRVRLAVALALHDLRDPRGDAALQRLADDPATSHLILPHSELGDAAGARGDWSAAKRELDWVVRLSPSFTDAIVKLGAVERELGNAKAARRRVDQALQLEPHHRAGTALRSLLDRVTEQQP